MAASKSRVVLATSDKFVERAPHRVAELKDIDTFVVEHDAARDELDKLVARRMRSPDRRSARMSVGAETLVPSFGPADSG